MLERMALPLRGLSNGIADAVAAVFRALGTPGRFLQDFLNGVWLGHSLDAVLVDVVVGVRTLRHDRPLRLPMSRRDWSSGRLPSRPYALR